MCSVVSNHTYEVKSLSVIKWTDLDISSSPSLVTHIQGDTRKVHSVKWHNGTRWFPQDIYIMARLAFFSVTLLIVVSRGLQWNMHHDDVIKWKHFPRYWLFVRGIHRSFPHKGQWRGALMSSLTCAWINGWVSNREAGDLRRHRAHYDVTVTAFVEFWLVVIVLSTLRALSFKLFSMVQGRCRLQSFCHSYHKSYKCRLLIIYCDFDILVFVIAVNYKIYAYGSRLAALYCGLIQVDSLVVVLLSPLMDSLDIFTHILWRRTIGTRIVVCLPQHRWSNHNGWINAIRTSIWCDHRATANNEQDLV